MALKGWKIDQNFSKSVIGTTDNVIEKSAKSLPNMIKGDDTGSVESNRDDEIKAIAKYGADEHRTKNPKLAKLFAHIKGEEEGHQKELDDALKGKMEIHQDADLLGPVTKVPKMVSTPKPNVRGMISGAKKLYSAIGRRPPMAAMPALRSYDQEIDMDMNTVSVFDAKANKPIKQYDESSDMDFAGKKTFRPSKFTPKRIKGKNPKFKPPKRSAMKNPSLDMDMEGGAGGGMGGAGMTTGGTGAGVITVGMGSYPKTRKKVKKAVHDVVITLAKFMANCAIKKAEKQKKHTPIVSEAQRRLFGAVASGKGKLAPGLSKQEALRHLKESKGKELPEKVKKEAK